MHAGLLKMFETRLKEQSPAAATVTYDYNSLCQYLDEMVSYVFTISACSLCVFWLVRAGASIV